MCGAASAEKYILFYSRVRVRVGVGIRVRVRGRVKVRARVRANVRVRRGRCDLAPAAGRLRGQPPYKVTSLYGKLLTW